MEDKEGMIRRLREIFGDGRIDTIDGISVAYDDWWFNVRPSNTEPLLRLVMEARDAETLARAREKVLAVLGTPES